MSNAAFFLSSTFNDMQSERDLFRENITPEIESRFKKFGMSVEFIDLRWGIDTKNVTENEANASVLYCAYRRKIRLDSERRRRGKRVRRQRIGTDGRISGKERYRTRNCLRAPFLYDYGQVPVLFQRQCRLWRRCCGKGDLCVGRRST